MSSQFIDHPDRVIQFFKVIEQNSLRIGELRVPRSFVKKYWHDISNPVTLVLPNGVKWKMGWVHRDNDVWFNNDWKKFKEFYSLDHGYFLTFKYEEGKSYFEVVIFGPSALEIDYPFMEESEQSSERPNSPLSPSNSSLMRMQTNTIDGAEDGPSSLRNNNIELTDLSEDSDSLRPRKRGRKWVPKKRSGSSAFQMANAKFRSDNPSVIREMRRTYIEKFTMLIPEKFITAHEKRARGRVTLCDTEGRTFDSDYKLNRCSRQIRFTDGWKEFVQAHKLKLGDACAFEQCSPLYFRVVIFRNKQESDPPIHQDSEIPTCNRKLGAGKKCKRKSSGRKRNNSMLYIKSTERTFVNVSNGIIRNFNLENETHVRLRVGEKTWHMMLSYYPKYRYGRLHNGWSTFVRDNNLEEGDACVLQTFKKEKFELEVKIQRKKE